MRIEEIDFPSDPDGELGNLRTALVQALHRADINVSAAKLLASTLGFTASVLRKIYKEDNIKSKASINKEAKEALAIKKRNADAAKLTAKHVKAARAKLLEESKLAKKKGTKVYNSYKATKK